MSIIPTANTRGGERVYHNYHTNTHAEYPYLNCLGPEVLQNLEFFTFWHMYTDYWLNTAKPQISNLKYSKI